VSPEVAREKHARHARETIALSVGLEDRREIIGDDRIGSDMKEVTALALHREA
jgi:hypothetical protein